MEVCDTPVSSKATSFPYSPYYKPFNIRVNIAIHIKEKVYDTLKNML